MPTYRVLAAALFSFSAAALVDGSGPGRRFSRRKRRLCRRAVPAAKPRRDDLPRGTRLRFSQRTGRGHCLRQSPSAVHSARYQPPRAERNLHRRCPGLRQPGQATPGRPSQPERQVAGRSVVRGIVRPRELRVDAEEPFDHLSGPAASHRRGRGGPISRILGLVHAVQPGAQPDVAAALSADDAQRGHRTPPGHRQGSAPDRDLEPEGRADQDRQPPSIGRGT